jgi:hypothetical protein
MASLKSNFNRNLPCDFLETGKQLYTHFFCLGRVKRLSPEAHGFGLCATPDSRMTQLRSSLVAVLGRARRLDPIAANIESIVRNFSEY